MSNSGSAEGGIFDKETIFMFSDSYYSLKKCVVNKKSQGHQHLIIDLFKYEGEFYKPAFETINKVAQELDINLSVTGISKDDIPKNLIPRQHYDNI